MEHRYSTRFARVAALGMLLALTFVTRLPAQTATGALRGTLLDPSGGAVPNATVQATSATGQMTTAKSNATGAYELANLPAGPYTIEVNVAGFNPYKKDAVAVVANRTEQFDITLNIQAQQEQVTVADQALSVDTSPSTNASSVVISDKELDALSTIRSATAASKSSPSPAPTRGMGNLPSTPPPRSSTHAILSSPHRSRPTLRYKPMKMSAARWGKMAPCFSTPTIATLTISPSSAPNCPPASLEPPSPIPASA
jgi:hypothetical protein